MNIFIGSGSGSEHKICAYQSTLIYNFFLKNGYNLVKTPNIADIIVLNGYPFEEFEEKINLLTINYYLKKYPKAKILLIGSIPGMMSYMNKVDRVDTIGWKNLSKFNDKFEHSISIFDIEVDNVKFFIPLSIDGIGLSKYGYIGKNVESRHIFYDNDYKITVEDLINGNYEIGKIEEYDGEKYSYLDDISGEYPIEICTGCGGYCTYCDIRNVSGFVKSIPLNKVLEKINRGLSLGYKEFHFIDEDSASYGLDIEIDFADLLNEINKIKGDFKIKIFYFEPGRLEKLYNKIDNDLWGKIINFCVPLQTTSQRILKLMNRNYNILNVMNIVNNIKNINPNIIITTQFIYGFPTETVEEFRDYFKMLKYFDELWFWYYSDRKGTKSVNFEGKITKTEISKRMIFLRKIKKNYINRIFDKNQTLKIGLNIMNARKF